MIFKSIWWLLLFAILQQAACNKEPSTNLLARRGDVVEASKSAKEAPVAESANAISTPDDSSPVQLSQLAAKSQSGRRRKGSTRRRKGSTRRRKGGSSRRRSSRRRSSRRRRKGGTPPAPSPRPKPPQTLPTFAPSPTQGPACEDTVIYGETDPPAGCMCQEMCYLFGDPHFVTFDGNGIVYFMEKKHGSGLNDFWAVDSSLIKIQGAAATPDSWMKGIAVSGPFIGNHKLVAFKHPNGQDDIKVTFDGQDILAGNDRFEGPMGIKGKRGSARQIMDELPDEMLKKIWAIAAGSKNWFQLHDAKQRWMQFTKIYSFNLPERVEILIVTSRLGGGHATEIVIKMPPQSGQSGWCGNFNGNANDDNQRALHVKVKPEDNYFAEAMLGLPEERAWAYENDMQAYENPPKKPECEGESRAMAEHACGHLKDKAFREGCVMDICMTHHIEWSEQIADAAAITKAHYGTMKKKCVPAGGK